VKKIPFNRKNRKQLKNEISYLNWENEHRKNEYLVHQKWQSYRINQLKIENEYLSQECKELQNETMKNTTKLLVQKEEVLIEFFKMQKIAKFWKKWAIFWCIMTIVFVMSIIFGTITTII
jgi:hypothetical protein